MVTEGALRTLRIDGCEVQGPVAALVSQCREISCTAAPAASTILCLSCPDACGFVWFFFLSVFLFLLLLAARCSGGGQGQVRLRQCRRRGSGGAACARHGASLGKKEEPKLCCSFVLAMLKA